MIDVTGMDVSYGVRVFWLGVGGCLLVQEGI